MLRSFARLRLVCKANRYPVHRDFSEVVQKSFSVQQGGSLLIDFYKSDKAVIEIKTAWQDHCDIEYDCDEAAWNGFKLEIKEDLDTQKLTITASPPKECEELKASPIKLLKLTLPEMLNVSIIAHHLDLRVKNKVECS